jgi:site-specific DNA recombinase
MLERMPGRKRDRLIKDRLAPPRDSPAAVEGRLPRGIGVERLRDLPTEWSQQSSSSSYSDLIQNKE